MELDENTVIVLTGDNGFYLGAHGLAGKWYPREESIRVPLVIYDPRLPASKRGRALDQMTLNVDLAPTLLAMAGLPVPETRRGGRRRARVESPEAAIGKGTGTRAFPSPSSAHRMVLNRTGL